VPGANPAPEKRPALPPKCENCCNCDPERAGSAGNSAYCTILNQWSKATVPACGGTMFGMTVDAIRKAKGLAPAADASEEK
jgi:hypothetical protein